MCADIRDGTLFPPGASYDSEAAAFGVSRLPPRIILEVAAGAGKSKLPPILAAELHGRRLDALSWFVPRLTLQEQAEQDFEDPELCTWLGSTHRIRQSTNEIDPCRGKAGWVSTQQAIEQNVTAALHEYSRGRRYGLVIDEGHHVALDGTLHRNLRPLVERAEVLIVMSGMFQRGDGRKIALLRYQSVTDRRGRSAEVWDPTPDPAGGYAVIRYQILDALKEGAIKPLEFHYYDGKLGWSTSAGDAHEVESFKEVDPDDLSAAIGTALETDYAHEVLEHAVEHWNGHRRKNPRGKLLVVAKGIRLAKKYVGYLKHLGVARVGIATTDAPEDALIQIGRYKREAEDPYGLDCLVTVAMAYEGLNVPQITHVAALTHIRSTPWIYQMLSRANRIDHGRTDCTKRQQYGFAFAPRDALFLKCAAVIRAQQDQFVYEQSDGPGGPKTPPAIVFPDFGNTNGTGAVEDLGTDDAVDDARMKQFEVVLRQHDLWGQVPLIVLGRAVAAAQQVQTPTAPSPGAQGSPRPWAGSKQRETKLRSQIQRMCALLDRTERDEAEAAGKAVPPWGRWNGLVIARYGKPRDQMWEDELEKVKEWLIRNLESRHVKVDVT